MSDIEVRLELDYQLGEDIKEKLIPRAIDWFTGEALQYEEMDEDDLDDIHYDEDDDEDEDDLSDDQDEDDSDDEVWPSPSPPGPFARITDSTQDDAGKPNKEAAECKQS